jgi:hypothetical protein
MHVFRRDSSAERSSAAAEVVPAAPALGHCSDGEQTPLDPVRPVDQPGEGMAPSASLRRVQTFMLMTTATISSIAASSK